MVPCRHHRRAKGRRMSDGVRSTRDGDGVTITVRVPEPLRLRIDSYTEKLDLPIPCRNWLFEAAVQNFDRQQAQRRDRDGA